MDLKYWNGEYDRLKGKDETKIYGELSNNLRPQAHTPEGLLDDSHSSSNDSDQIFYHHRNKRKFSPQQSKKWLWLKLQEHKNKICSNDKLSALLCDNSYAERDLFLVLVDVLSTIGFYVPVGTVAIILARGGLKRLCEENYR